MSGVTPVLCEKLIDQLEQQARTFEPTIVLGQQITGLDRQEDGTFLLTSATGEQHWTRTIVLAVGYGILKMAKLEIEGRTAMRLRTCIILYKSWSRSGTSTF